MSHLRLLKLTALLVPTACAIVACGSSDNRTPTPTTSSGGEGGSGGSTVHILTATSSGTGGLTSASASSSAGTPAPIPNCKGDAGKWKELTAGPIACTSGEDCCVIMNDCHAKAQIVAKEHMEGALEVWPSCPGECSDCVARAIEVACVAGACLGRVIPDENSLSLLREDHCGTSLEFLKTTSGPVGVQFTCGGGAGP